MMPKQIDCSELVELVTLYLEGSLDLEDRARFDAHLLECDGCENYLQQFRSTLATVGKIPAGELDPAFRGRLMRVFQDWR